MSMTVRARVRNGRLTLDEPTDLPEGTEVELVAMDADEEPWDLSPEQEAELTDRMAGAERVELVPADEVFARLRAAR